MGKIFDMGRCLDATTMTTVDAEPLTMESMREVMAKLRDLPKPTQVDFLFTDMYPMGEYHMVAIPKHLMQYRPLYGYNRDVDKKEKVVIIALGTAQPDKPESEE